MNRRLKKTWAVVGCLFVTAVIVFVWARVLSSRDRSAAGILTSPNAQLQHRAVRAREQLPQAAITAASLAAQEAAELAQLREWERRRADANKKAGQ